MASVLTLYYNNPMQSGSSAGLLDVNQPTASTSTTGWVVGTLNPTLYSRMSFGVKLTTTALHSSPVELGGAPVATAGLFATDCWRLSAATSGTFSAGTWYSALSAVAVSTGGSQDGNGRWRLWRSSSVSGANATELTKGTMVGSVITNLNTGVAQSSSASTNIGSVTLSNEFLFLQLAWQLVGATGTSTSDVVLRFGPITNLTNGSHLVTPIFTPTAAAGGATAGFYTHRKQYDLVN